MRASESSLSFIIVRVISQSEQKPIVLSGLLADTHSIAWLMKQLSTKGTNTWNSFKQLSYSVLCSPRRGLKSQMLLKSLSTRKANMSSCRGTRVTPSIWLSKESLWLLKWINQVRNLTKSCSITQVCILENLHWWRISAHRQVSYVKLIVLWLAWIDIVLRDWLDP